MSAATTTNGRTDYAVCRCSNGQHHAAEHQDIPRPGAPDMAAVKALWPTAHLVTRRIDWTPWRAR